jgi:hypothetical protein
MTPQEVVLAAQEVDGLIQAQGHHLSFGYGGATTAYSSDEGDDAQWLRQFFEGYFLPSDTVEPDATVSSTADAGLFALLQEYASQQPKPTLGKNEYVDIPFTDDVALIQAKATKVTPEQDVFHLLFRAQRRIVLATSGNREVRREEAMQTLRALAKWLLLERGWIPMHSACVARDGRGICITGAKASGKTSTLLNLLARNSCDLLAIDKFLIRDAGSRMEICGLPGKSGIRVGSAIAQPKVLAWISEQATPFFPNIGADQVRQIAETNTPEQLRTRPEKIHLLPAELADLFTVSITPSAPLALVLVPVFDLDATEARLVRVEPEQSAELLMESYAGLLSKGEGFLLHFFDLSDAILKARLASLLSTYLPEIETYELHQNHTTNEHAAQLVAGLLQSGK